MSGENNPMYGKRHSAETRSKISEKRKGTKLSEERKRQMSENAPKRPVIQIDLNGNVVCRFSSIKQAADKVNAKAQNISAVCKGKQKSCHGYIWRYADVDS